MNPSYTSVSYNGSRAPDRIYLYLATGLCKRCAVRITPPSLSSFYFLRSLVRSFHPPFPPTTLRSELARTLGLTRLLVLPLLSIHPLSEASYFTFVLAAGAIVQRVENRTSVSAARPSFAKITVWRQTFHFLPDCQRSSLRGWSRGFAALVEVGLS